ncbi:unnamed protein product [Acanthoscelides obtectus]|uniref:DNA repair protein RAD50 n=2 Tax=Acanthoscelides obtectus TaxID=200917 RepID=A0A9P0NZV6_ACAOB|nr:unnamed protein product [Acanthoscelides obtectus]CAK1658665.1 DNA repair protein RAD50 [Acanthoscelides obtectus]
MSHLNALTICGVRLFSPEENQKVLFSTPVTLFLGQNGCGKTTIIECIRYALTGEIPAGTNNGQGFLNDPDMTHVSITKGNVKLKYTDNIGNVITVSRFMQVQKKADGKMQFKSLNVNIRKHAPDGETNDISGRCVDADNFCCNSLGVSKSILNNVLFCHQENSYWPLDEPKKLKEKFDEIFEAVKYNKYIDFVRKDIKNRQLNIKVFREKVETRRIIKDEVEKCRAKFEARQIELNEIQNSVQEKSDEIKPLEDRRNEICDLEESIGSLQRNLIQKQTESKGLQGQQGILLKKITLVFEGTDDDLQNRIKSFKQLQQVEEDNIKQLEQKNKEIIAENNTVGVAIQKIQMKIGELKEEQKQHRNKQQEVKVLVEKLRNKLDINRNIDWESTEEIADELESAIQKLDVEYAKLVRDKEEEEKELQNQIDTAREKFVSVRQIIESKKGLVREYGGKARDIRDQLDQLGSSDSQLKIVGDKIEKLQTTLSSLKSSFSERDKNIEIDKLKGAIDAKEQSLEKLEREHRILQQNYHHEQNLEREIAAVAEKEMEINKIKSKHASNFKLLFDDDTPGSNFKRYVQRIQNEEEAKCKRLTIRIGKLEKAVSSLETELKMQKRKLESDKEQLANYEKKVVQACRGKSFDESLKESYANKETLQKQKGQYSSAKIMYDAFIEKLRKDACCPICKTNFGDKPTEKEEIINSMKGKIALLPQKLIENEKRLREIEEAYNKLQGLKPISEEIETLTKRKIPELEEEVKKLEEEYNEKQMELASDKAQLELPQKKVEVCKNVISDATLLDRYIDEIKSSKENIEKYRSQIVTVPSERSREEAEAEIDAGKAELSNLKHQYESCKKMLDQHRERCQQLNDQIQKETKKQLDIQKLLQERPMLETQLKEFEEKLSALKSELEELEDQVRECNKQLNTAIEERQSVVKKNNKLKNEESLKINANKTLLADIKKLYNAIETYVRNKTEGELDLTVEKLAKLKIKEKDLDDQKNAIIDSISTTKQNLAKKETEYRNLTDNVTLRELKVSEKKLIDEIRDLEKNIKGFNYRSLRTEKIEIDKKLEKAHREINTLTGKQEEVERAIKEFQADLKKPENKDAYKNYLKQYHELVVEEHVVEDLGTYINVLEKCVLKFHEDRMVHINTIIKELWREIYKGNDIDYIEIQTNEDMKGGGLNKRRTYNYKVVQVKNTIELEMRGRCSAGQKVLACLIIRIALAEAFSSHCGILALDEPTTNLDKENIISLSNTLANLVQQRELAKNFQLLVITHDEEFLSGLTRSLSTDGYWEVKRNHSGFSTVERRLL